MFTGIVQEIGVIRSVSTTSAGKRLEILTKKTRPSLGASVSVNGVCLTAAKLIKGGFIADVIPETLKLTTLGSLKAGDNVNIEPSLRMGDELGGHMVSGHIDAKAEVINIKNLLKETLIMIALPASIKKLITKKGSVCIDGVSLTVANVSAKTFEVALIPFTLKETTLGKLKKGDQVNVEADLLARYLFRMIKRK